MKILGEKILKIISIPTLILGAYIGINRFSSEQTNTEIFTQTEKEFQQSEYAAASILDMFEEEKNWIEDKEFETELALLKKYPETYRIPGKTHIDSIDVTVSKLLNNAKYWRIIGPSGWDALPKEIRDESLKRQFESYGYALDSTVWNEMNLNDWNKLPKIVRMTSFLKIAEKIAEEYDLQKYSKQPGVIEKFQSILIQESYLNHRSVRRENKTVKPKKNNYTNTDIGVGQNSDWSRNRLRKTNEFKNIKDENFFNPLISISAAAYEFRDRLKEANGNLELAIKAYNAGISAARTNTERAKEYFNWVQNRHKILTEPDKNLQPTWTYINNKLKE